MENSEANKAYRVFNKRGKAIEELVYVVFSKNLEELFGSEDIEADSPNK